MTPDVSFLAGGSTLNVASGVRTRVYREQLTSGRRVELEAIAVCFQAAAPSTIATVELILNGATLYLEDLFISTGGSGYALPPIEFDAIGDLEFYVTQSSGGAATVPAHLQGRYVAAR